MNSSIEKIRLYGDPVLKKKSESVEDFDDKLEEFIEQMLDSMFDKKGLGLAAPQIGKLKRVIVIDKSFGETVDDFLAMINPEILGNDGEYVIQEGCLSVPGIYEDLERPERIQASYMDIKGKKHIIEADGLLARIILHETDHLKTGSDVH